MGTLRHKFYGKMTESARQAGAAAQNFVLLSAGICSILLTVHAIPSISFSEPAVFAGTILLCGILCLLPGIRGTWRIAGAAVLLFSAGVFAAVRWSSLREEMSVLFSCLSGSLTGRQENVTEAVFFAAFLVLFLLFFLEIVCRIHWLPYLFLTAIMAGAPFLGIDVGIGAVFSGLIFQLSFWMIHISGKRPVTAKSAAEEGRRQVLPVRCGVFMAGILSVLFSISLILESVWGSGLAGLVYSGEGFLTRSMQRISGRADDPASDGHVSRGNNYPTGETQLVVTAPDEPRETLYLKGFSGGQYTGGEWEPADDTSVFHNVALSLGWEEWESWIGMVYQSLYYVMNQETAPDGTERRTLLVNCPGGDYETLYIPYYSGWLNRNNIRETGYAIGYFEESEMDIDWENVSDDFWMSADWIRRIQETYMEEIQDVYTQVPEERLPRLTELCRENSLDSLDEVTAFICTVLQSNASYTRTPGGAPVNEDIVEYFLFDSHEGYCVHYASAATLLYRLYGVPARYVSGYAVQPSDFVQQDNGSWRAEVTDESAHAWTEIFLEDYGWTPVEVTPSSDERIDMSYPGLDTDMLEEAASGLSVDTEGMTEDRDNTGDNGEEMAADDSTDHEGSTFSLREYRSRILFLITAASAAGLTVLLLAVNYRRRGRRILEQMNCRQIFARFMKMLHFAGYMSEYTGTEKDFAQRLSGEILCLNKAEALRLTDTVTRAAYGKGEANASENEFVRQIYIRTAGWLGGKMKGIRKWRFALKFWWNDNRK